MANNDIEEQNGRLEQKGRLDELGNLVDKYAQSRALGLLIPLSVVVINFILLVVAMELVRWKPQARWTHFVLFGVMAWVAVGGVWITFRLAKRYGYSFYRRDGEVKLKTARIPIWMWLVLFVPALSIAVLSQHDVMPIRWALVLTLLSLAFFLFCSGRKERERPLGVVWGGMLLFWAILAALGMPTPFTGKDWIYSYCVASGVYVVGSGVATAVVVHIYNRMILKRIKQLKPFEQHSEADTQ